MVEPIFFLYITVAIISYGIQAPLLVFFTRKFDSLIVTVYSRLSLVISMLPILLLYDFGDVFIIRDYIAELVLASVLGSFGFIMSLQSAKYVPVGISETLRQSTYITTAVILGFLFLSEVIPLSILSLLTLLVVAISVLVLTKSKQAHLNTKDAWKGYIYGILSGFGFAGGFFYFSVLSREIHPFHATYFWMATMGLLMLLWLSILITFGKYKNSLRIPTKSALAIAAISLTTITGTVSFAFAVNHGFFALASGLSALSTAVAAIIGWFLFKERLSRLQISAVFAAVVLVLMIRLFV